MSNQRITKEIAELVVEILENRFSFEARIDYEYSGRGMYGKTCVSIVTAPEPVCFGAAIAIAYQQQPSLFSMSLVKHLDLRMDNMGHDRVFY